MLVDGPIEWAETSIPAGSKLDLLQHAYNARLGMAALPTDATVVLVPFATDGSAALGAGDEVMESAREEIVLHPDARGAEKDTKPDVFRYVAWSSGASVEVAKTRSAHVAVATVGRVEVWRITVDSSVNAVLVGSYSKNRIRGICWHPTVETLVVHNDVEVDLIAVTADGRLYPHPLELEQELGTSEKTKHCGWSPCGLVLARSAERRVQFYSWSAIDELAKVAPLVSSYRVDAPLAAALLGDDSKVGSISGVRLLSPSVCVLVTDTPLVLADIKSDASSNDAPSSISTSALKMGDGTASSNVIDLTSLRITATSKSSLLNILENPRMSEAQPVTPGSTRNSHLAVVARNPAGEWKQYAKVALEQLAIPDVLDVEAMRVMIGSTISNRIVAVHLDHSLKSGWSASISGGLELPDSHVCRGVRLAKTSPFVQVASTEKIKRTFFHAASGPQRIQLSKFKVPRRRREPTDRKQSIEAPPVAPATSSPESGDAQPRAASHPDVMAALLSRMEALQTLMVTRFDQVERRLDDVTTRLDGLEVLQQAKRPSL